MTPAVGGAPSRFGLARRVAERSDWVATDGRTIAYGTGRRLLLRDRPGGEITSLEPGFEVLDAILVGRQLYLAGAGPTLAAIDLDAAEPRRPVVVSLAPPLAGTPHLGRMGGRLLVAEDGYGVRILAPVADHRGGHRFGPQLEELGRYPLRERIAAVAAFGSTVYVVADSSVLEIEAGVPAAPSLTRVLLTDDDLAAITASDAALYGIGAGGLRAWSRAFGGPALWVDPAIRGRSIRIAGRTVHVAAGELGLFTYRDRSSLSQIHDVTVADNFFSPAALTIDVGDSVRWSNTAGFHNVHSCFPDQFGCDGATANEAFSSGEPAPPIWLFTYMFTSAGSNPYICQSHAQGMTGSVTVVEPPAGPPRVPDGTTGDPLLVRKLNPLGGRLSIQWDADACDGAVNHHILYGFGSRLPAAPGGVYRPNGAVCSIGTVSPFTWLFGPPATLDPTGLLWWLVVADDGADREGSWGTDSFGSERQGPAPGGASGECGFEIKDLSNACGQ